MIKQIVLRSEDYNEASLLTSCFYPRPNNPGRVFFLSKGQLHNSFSQRATAVVRLAQTFKPRLPTHTEAITRLFLPEASLQSLPKRPQEMEFSKRIKTS